MSIHSQDNKDKIINVRLDNKLYKTLKLYCLLKETTLSDVVRNVLLEYEKRIKNDIPLDLKF